MFDTRINIINKVLIEHGLASGTGVQLYTQPQIESKLTTAFHTLVAKRFWPWLTKTTFHALDGVTGIVTDSNIDIASVEDIAWVRRYPYGTPDTLQYLAGAPYVDGMADSFDALPWDDVNYSTKLLQFYPPTLSDAIAIKAKHYPKTFNADSDIIPFDAVCLVHYLTFLLLSTDGINPTATTVQFNLFDQRYKDIVESEANHVSVYGTANLTNTFTVAGT